MKFSTGKVTRLKHATGVDMQKLAEIKRRARALRHSTGHESDMIHATGKEFDYKRMYEELLEEGEKLKEETTEVKLEVK